MIEKRYWLYGVLPVYATLLGIGIWRHEPWFDEAQAWLLARDAGLFELLTRWLRYEGSPGLWHVLLAVPAKLGLPYLSLNLLSGLIALGSVVVFVRYSRFPALIKVMLPFSYYAFYQYAIVARSYVLMPLWLFLIAALYRKKMQRIGLFCVLLCLLANTNLHGLLISLSLMVIHVFDLRPQWRRLDKAARARHLAALLAFSIMLVLLVLQLMPPDDMVWAKGYDPSPLRFLAITEIMLSNSLAGTPFVSLPVLAIICFWLHRHKVLHVFLLPVLLLSLLFSMKVAKVWHEGILFFMLVFAAWLAFENQEASGPAKDRPLPPMDRALPLFLALVLLVQIRWSIGAFQYDFRNNYSASRDVAHYIREHDLSAKTIYVSSFHSISILPYFQENIFKNHNGGHKPCFWLWSTQNSLIGNPRWRYGDGPGPLAQIRHDRPDIAILGIKFPHQELRQSLPGYEVIRRFDGNICWKCGIYEADSFVLLRRTDPPAE